MLKAIQEGYYNNGTRDPSYDSILFYFIKIKFGSYRYLHDTAFDNFSVQLSILK